MVQYHALGLLFHIRKTDRLAVTKLVAKLTKINMRSPFAVCMLVSITIKFIINKIELFHTTMTYITHMFKIFR